MSKVHDVELLEFNVPTELSGRVFAVTAAFLAGIEKINADGGVLTELHSPLLNDLGYYDQIERTCAIDEHRVCGKLTNLRLIDPDAGHDSDPTHASRTVLVADFEPTGVYEHLLLDHLHLGRELWFAARTLCWIDSTDQRHYVNRFVTADVDPIPPLPRE